MDEKSDVLETPQICSFKHENNVFALTFKEEAQKQPDLLRQQSITSELSSSNIPIILPDVINNYTNNVATLTSSTSSASTSTTATNSGSSNASFSPPQITSNLDGFKSSAPKKNILMRTISQTEAENQKQEMLSKANTVDQTVNNMSPPLAAVLNAQKFNIPLLEQLNNDFNLKNDTNSKLELSNHQTQQTQSLKRAGSGDFIESKSSPKYFKILPEFNPQKSFEQQQQLQQQQSKMNLSTNSSPAPIQSAICDIGSDSILKSIKDQVIKQKITNKTIDFCIEKFDGNVSRSSSSSNDDAVTSSDQTADKKTKTKRRSIEANSDVRKQQIRNSNREAARRCRERRRNYIESLEATIRNLEAKQKNLTIENTSLRQEVVGLKKIISDHKITSYPAVNNSTEQNANLIYNNPTNPSANSNINIGAYLRQQSQQLNKDLSLISGVELPNTNTTTNTNHLLVINGLNMNAAIENSALNSNTTNMINLNNNQVIKKIVDSLMNNKSLIELKQNN